MGDYYISTEKEKLDIPKIHREIKDSYWGGYRTFAMTAMTIEKSICFGVYSEDNQQMGFARLLSDGVVFAYLMDVMVFDPFKGKGLGKKLVEHILKHPLVDGVLTVALKTRDAHRLYKNFGFTEISDTEMWMVKDTATYE